MVATKAARHAEVAKAFDVDCDEDNRDDSEGKALEPLARPEARDTERALAHAGLLAGAPPVICEGASLPFVGALLILPALAVTGLVKASEKVLGLPKAAFYSLRCCCCRWCSARCSASVAQRA